MHPIHDLPDVCGDCGSPWEQCTCPPTVVGFVEVTIHDDGATEVRDFPVIRSIAHYNRDEPRRDNYLGA